MSTALKQKFEDVYPLTPFQQGVLFHVLDTPTAGMYLNQQRYTLRGDLDLAAFRKALQAVMDRHPILRTAFWLSGLEGPHQVVFRQVKLPWVMYDWSELSPGETSKRVADFLHSDFQSGFDLKRVPLNRTTLIRTEPDLYEFIWSFHLLLMDGWSMQVILRDLLELYQSFCNSKPSALEPPLPYREFIKWQQQQPQDQAEAYWRKTLMGFTKPTSLVYDRMPLAGFPEQPHFKEKVLLLDESTTEDLRAFALQYRLTLNTLIQGAWALLLSRRSATTDVVFGSAVSGRSAFIPNIDNAVGVFVNVLPVRVLVPLDVKVVTWLKEFQRQQVEARRFEFCALPNIHRWSDMPRSQPLFESVVVFQNFPTGVDLPESAGIKVIKVGMVERNSAPLALVVEPGSRLHLRLVYMGSRFDDATIDQMHENLHKILLQLMSRVDDPLSSVSYQTATERQFLIDSFNQNLASL
jgi:Condensation domain